MDGRHFRILFPVSIFTYI